MQCHAHKTHIHTCMYLILKWCIWYIHCSICIYLVVFACFWLRVFSPHSIFYRLFLNEGRRIRKNRLSKMYCWFQRYTNLIKATTWPCSVSLNACKVLLLKVMMVFLIFSGQILKKAIKILQALRLKLNSLNQTCISLESTRITQLDKTILLILLQKKRVENWLWRKTKFLWRKIAS